MACVWVRWGGVGVGVFFLPMAPPMITDHDSRVERKTIVTQTYF